MRLSIRSTKKTIIRAALVTGVAVFGFGFFAYMQTSTPEALAQQQGAKLITLHDRGETTTFMTDRDTIGAALEAAHVDLDEKDAVEPSRDEKLVAADYQVNVYRARPVTVVDGSLKQKVFTPYQSAERIVRDLGVSLYPEDLTKVTRSENILSQGSGLQLEITRATPFELTLYGKTDTARTQATTVAALLKEKKITLSADDRTSLPLEAPIAEGMQLRVWREGKQTITVDEEVAFATEKIQDADRKVGYREVKTPGEKGERSVTYEVVIQDGKEVSRTEIASVSKKEPKKQVEIVGSKPEFDGDFAAALSKLRACEAGGNYANKKNPSYRGAYQFGYGTWGNKYGIYDPADASPAQQDQAARELYLRRGWQPWPHCGSTLPDTYR